jgi:hypothetical protein
MSNLKDQLIKLGTTHKELRPNIRPVLAELQKEAGPKPIKGKSTLQGVYERVTHMIHAELLETASRNGYKAGAANSKEASFMVEGRRVIVKSWVADDQIKARTYLMSGMSKDDEWVMDFRANDSFVMIGMKVFGEIRNRL